jgi:hypothetical protein
MTNQYVFIADLEDGCPAAAGWVDYFDHLTLPLTGQALADAQAILPAGTTRQPPKAAWGTAGAAWPTSTGSAPHQPGHQPRGWTQVSQAQHILAVIVGLITGVLLMESNGAMVEAARAGGRAIPELWPLGTEALALAMEVSVLEAKRLGHRAVLRLSWLLLVASVTLSTLLQVAVAPPTLVGYLTAGATPVWLLGSFAVLSLLYRADQAPAAAEPSAEQAPASAAVAPSSAQTPSTGAEALTKRAQAERAYAELSASGAPVSAGSWPPLLGSAPAPPAPWSPSSRPNR